MKKVVKWCAGMILAFIFAFLYAHVDYMTFLYDRDVDTSDYVSTGVLQDLQVSQGFVCEEEFLDGIQVKCTSVGNVEGISVSYTVEDETSGVTVAEGTVQGTDIKHNKFNRIEFERIEGSKGKNYTVSFKENGADAMNGVSFYFAQDMDGKDSLFFNGEKVDGFSLVIRTFSHRFDFETFGVVLIFCAYIVGFLKVLYKLFK